MMRKIFYILMAFIVVAACNKETEYQPDTTLYTSGTVNLCASIEEIMTKLVVDQSGRGLWTEGDRIAVACDDGSFVEFELNGTGETKRAIFTGDIPEGRTLGKVAVWPANAVVSLEGDELTLKTPTEYSSDNIAFDGIMVANISDSWEITFRHVMARPIIKIEGLPSYTSYITLEAEGYSLGGRVSMNITDKEGIKATKGSRALTISLVEAGTTIELPINMPVAEYTKLTATLYDEKDELVHSQQINDMTLSLDRATTTYVNSKLVGILERYDPVDVEYIEVCGIKWAKGNLQANQGSKQKGMQDGWRIAPAQWHGFCYDLIESTVDKVTYTYNPDSPTEMRYKNSTTQFEHFNLGGLARNARFYSDGNWLKPEDSDGFDISGKIYSDIKGVTEVEGRDRWANSGTFTASNSEIWGDLAYWASRGAYRTPTYEEMNKLLTDAYIQIGWIETKDFGDDKDFKVWGVLFTDPEGEQVPGYNNSFIKNEKFTVDELETGLFLPKSGRRNNSTSTTVIQARNQGTYRTTIFVGDGECTSGAAGEYRWYSYAMHISGNAISWQSTIGSAYDTAAGFLIRPIANENYDPNNI